MTRLLAPAPTESTVANTRTRPWLGIGLIALGLGVAASALLGPLAFDLIHYHLSEGAANQVIGGDLAALVLVAPAAIWAGILTLRRHRAGPVIGIGPALFAVYIHTQLSLGGDFIRYPGNSENFFLLDLGLFVLGLLVAIGTWIMIDVSALPRARPWFDRALAIFLFVVSLFLIGGLHLPHLLQVWGGNPSEEYLADPGPFWIVKLMDLGLIVPAMIAGGVGLLAGAAWAQKLKYALVGWFGLLGASVAGMAVMMQLTDAPGATISNVVAFGIFAAIGLTLAAILYWPLFSRTER